MNDEPLEFEAEVDSLAAMSFGPTHVVGVGASAGGLEALEKLFRAMPSMTNMSFVVIQHLSPDFKSLMDELMMRFSTMPVRLIDRQMQLEPNTIYLLAPKKEVTVEGNTLVVHERPSGKQLSMPINLFFRSLAASWADKAVAVVLSGTGSDGSDGVLNVRDAGGVVLVQDPNTAKFDGMPQNAISTGCVDAILSPEEMPSAIISIAADPLLPRNSERDSLSDDELRHVQGIDRIYELLKIRYNLDFRLYKPSTITRRIHRRITLNGNNTSIDDYVRKLESDESELSSLYKDLLIGVTTFFRDADAFEALRSKGLVELVKELEPSQEFRVWVCGCSTGQEAYSIAIMVYEEFVRQGRTPNIKIFATDIHRDSVQIAADGVYSETALESLPPEYKEKYFVALGGGNFKIHSKIRKMIIFSDHNLLKNPPFTRMHLVSCRNLLIYFRAEAQIPAVTAFNFSLLPEGLLFLGASETLGTLADDFDTVDSHWKIYKKTRESRNNLSMKSQDSYGVLSTYESHRGRSDRAQPLMRLYHHLLDTYIPSGILLSESYELLHVFGDAYRHMRIPSGRHTGDVFSMLSQSLSIALSTALRNIRNQPVAMSYRGIRGEGDVLIELTVEPIFDKLSGRRFYLVIIIQQDGGQSDAGHIEDVIEKEFSLPAESAEYVNQLKQELQRTQEALQTNAEELETSNEELQASNEELQASNEELQSTNEELHSVNEELFTVNSELEQKIVQLDRLTADLRNLVDSSQVCSVFLNANYTIRMFTSHANDVFNLVVQDIGRDIRDFTPKIPDPKFHEDLKQAIEFGNPTSVELAFAETTYLRRCTPYHSGVGTGLNIEAEGVIVTYVDVSTIYRSIGPSWLHKLSRMF